MGEIGVFLYPREEPGKTFNFQLDLAICNNVALLHFERMHRAL